MLCSLLGKPHILQPNCGSSPNLAILSLLGAFSWLVSFKCVSVLCNVRLLPWRPGCKHTPSRLLLFCCVLLE